MSDSPDQSDKKPELTARDVILEQAERLTSSALTLRARYNLACFYCSQARADSTNATEKLASAWAELVDVADEPALARRAAHDPSLLPLREHPAYEAKFEAKFGAAKDIPRGGRALGDLAVVGKLAVPLARDGITTVGQLRKKLASKEGAKLISETHQLSDRTITRWAKVVELIEEIPNLGIGGANLLTSLGIFSIPDLARQNPDSLRHRIVDANRAHVHLADAPSSADVTSWVGTAKGLAG